MQRTVIQQCGITAASERQPHSSTDDANTLQVNVKVKIKVKVKVNVKVKEVDLYGAFIIVLHTQGAQVRIT